MKPFSKHPLATDMRRSLLILVIGMAGTLAIAVLFPLLIQHNVEQFLSLASYGHNLARAQVAAMIGVVWGVVRLANLRFASFAMALVVAMTAVYMLSCLLLFVTGLVRQAFVGRRVTPPHAAVQASIRRGNIVERRWTVLFALAFTACVLVINALARRPLKLTLDSVALLMPVGAFVFGSMYYWYRLRALFTPSGRDLRLRVSYTRMNMEPNVYSSVELALVLLVVINAVAPAVALSDRLSLAFVAPKMKAVLGQFRDADLPVEVREKLQPPVDYATKLTSSGFLARAIDGACDAEGVSVARLKAEGLRIAYRTVVAFLLVTLVWDLVLLYVALGRPRTAVLRVLLAVGEATLVGALVQYGIPLLFGLHVGTPDILLLVLLFTMGVARQAASREMHRSAPDY